MCPGSSQKRVHFCSSKEGHGQDPKVSLHHLMPKQGVGEGWVPSSQANGEVSGPGSVKFPVVGACM